jgi:hypothetical protein
MATYAWRIDKDYLADDAAPAGTNSNAAGITGPSKIPPHSPLGLTLTIAGADRPTSPHYEPETNLDILACIAALRSWLTEEEDHRALMTKRNGATWQQLGEALGMSRQAAQQRWGRP